MLETIALAALFFLFPEFDETRASDLAAPVRIEAAGYPIDARDGHAAPFVCDFDGDGIQDLLVGEFDGGRCWIYLNEGTNAEPNLAAGVPFMAGGKNGRIPAG
ncbi:MAG: VCBS repeat-containing protein [Planctomycetes bacterium]|nr:VCBS repeat-containing protein [Planctomycetota bacterium]